MPFKLEGITVIQGATLELSAKQLGELADAAKPLRDVCERYAIRPGSEVVDPGSRPEEIAALDVVSEFLEACESMMSQAGVVRPKRRMTRRKKKAG